MSLSILIGRGLDLRKANVKKRISKEEIDCSGQYEVLKVRSVGRERFRRKRSRRKISPKPDASTEISGDYGEKVPPVPIPNTEVKLLRVESTWLVTAREDSSSPDSMKSLSCKTTGLSLRFGGKREMESKEKGGGEERKATPQSAAADSSPYTGEPSVARRYRVLMG